MKNLIEQFKAFIARGKVVDLAVGVMIGAAFKSIVDSLVNDIISPLLGLFVDADFAELGFSVGGVTIGYGAFITAVINFFLMAVVLFLLLKAVNSLEAFGAKRLHRRRAEAAPQPRLCPFCRLEIAADATRCPHCTSALAEGAPAQGSDFS
ncbi:MAG: large conductance mechanosensitive channel protein MscL [Clostridia bacterium]|nr:large conductance mechanosensitive channel protein MscL [Clostridia bacterium]